MRKYFFVLFVIGVIQIGIFRAKAGEDNLKQAGQKYENITPQQVKQKIDVHEDVLLLDVRTKLEFRGALGHLPGAVVIPHTKLSRASLDVFGGKDRQIIVYCKNGNRSKVGSEILIKKRFKNVKNMTGGMIEWNRLFKNKNPKKSKARD